MFLASIDGGRSGVPWAAEDMPGWMIGFQQGTGRKMQNNDGGSCNMPHGNMPHGAPCHRYRNPDATDINRLFPWDCCAQHRNGADQQKIG